MGVKIRTMWMTPFYLFFGVLLVYIFQSQINLNKFKIFIPVFVFIFILTPFTYSYVSITESDKRTDYPGKKNAHMLQIEWDKKYNSKINMIIGDEWVAGNYSYHLKSRPKWYGPMTEVNVSSFKNYDHYCFEKFCVASK